MPTPGVHFSHACMFYWIESIPSHREEGVKHRSERGRDGAKESGSPSINTRPGSSTAISLTLDAASTSRRGAFGYRVLFLDKASKMCMCTIFRPFLRHDRQQRKTEPRQHYQRLPKLPATEIVSTQLAAPIHPTPGTWATDQIPAVRVNARDMFEVLRSEFGKDRFEVELNEDVYTITAPRRLTEQEKRKFYG